MSDGAIKPRRHRLEIRVTPEQDALIRQAADLEDTAVTEFVLDADHPLRLCRRMKDVRASLDSSADG